MEDRSFVPVVFLANACQDEKYRHDRPRGERAMLERLEESLIDSGNIQVARVDPENGVFFLDLFRKYKYTPAVSVLHLTGNERDCRQGWCVQTGLGHESLNSRDLSRLLSGMQGLQLVILSGCASIERVEMLIGLDIPAILVTDELEENPLTFDIIDQFYHALSQHYSIREAFDRARTLFPYKYQYREAQYDLDLNRFSWPDQDVGMIPWGLYYLTENAPQLNQRLALPAPAERVLPPEPAPRHVPVEETEDEVLSLSFLKWALVAMFAIVLGILVLDTFPFALPARYQAVKTKGHGDGKFHIQMFSLAQYPDCKKADPAYTAAIYKNLQVLAQEDSQHISLSFVEEKTCPEAYREAEEAIRSGKADMVFWGNYAEQEPDQVRVRLHAEYVQKRGSQYTTERKEMEMGGNQEWFSGYSDASFPAIRNLIYLAAGTYRYDNREYELCLEYLSGIPLSEDTTYIQVDRLMARAYMALNKYERAARRYEHILSIQPGNANAYLERGEMFASIGKYEDAMLNYERAIYFEPGMKPAYRGRAALHMHTHNYEAAIMDVKEMIQLDPDDPLAFGMLANLYALQDNKSLFFRYMEVALRKGFPPQEFLESPACKKYRDSDGFRVLIETYHR